MTVLDFLKTSTSFLSTLPATFALGTKSPTYAEALPAAAYDYFSSSSTSSALSSPSILITHVNQAWLVA